MRGSHELAVAGWRATPSSVKLRIEKELAKRMGWSVAKAAQMINVFFSASSAGGGSGNSGSGSRGSTGSANLTNRDKPRIEDGNLREGWKHIAARHITGNHPSGAGELFPPGTTRQQLQEAAEQIIEKGTRISEPKLRIQTFEKRIILNGKRMWVRLIVDSKDGNRVITIFSVTK